MDTVADIRGALDLLWAEGYAVDAVGVDEWRVTPPADRPAAIGGLLVCPSARLVDLAALHNIVRSQAARAAIEHDMIASAAHGQAALARLGWTLNAYGDGRWRLIAPEGQQDHPEHESMIGQPRLITLAAALEEEARLRILARLGWDDPSAPNAPAENENVGVEG